MRRQLTILIIGVLLVGVLAAPVSAASGTTTTSAQTTTTTSTGNNTTITHQNLSLGARISGMIAAQQARVQGAAESAAYQTNLSQSTNQSESATVIANQSQQIQTKLAHIKQQKTALQAQFHNGSISRLAYHTQMVQLMGRKKALGRMMNTSVSHAQNLSPHARAHAHLNMSALSALRNQSQKGTMHDASTLAHALHAHHHHHVSGRGQSPSNQSQHGDNASQQAPTHPHGRGHGHHPHGPFAHSHSQTHANVSANFTGSNTTLNASQSESVNLST